MADVSIKRHDDKVEFADTLKVNGVPVDLTDCTVSFLLKKTGLAIKQAAVIVYPTEQADPDKRGKVKYHVTPDDVAVKGKYRQEWEVVFTDDEILTFPNDDYNNVEILEDLG